MNIDSVEADFWLELAQIQAESIGWIPLDEGAYLHIGSDGSNNTSANTSVIEVVGLPRSEMNGSNVLWVF